MPSTALITLVTAFGVAFSASATLLRGDGNCDGAVSAADASAMAMAVEGDNGVCRNLDSNGDAQTDESDIAVATSALFAAPVEEFVAQFDDFVCLLDWPRVRHLRLENTVGNFDEAWETAVASGQMSGLQFPLGTIVQLIPGEAMVKRGGDFDPDNNNWEYFRLNTARGSTRILERGGSETNGGACFGCHSAARDFDFICETNHGCVQLGLTDALVDSLQAGDNRCRD